MGEALFEELGEGAVFEALVVLAAEDEGGDDGCLGENWMVIEAKRWTVRDRQVVGWVV